MRLAKRINVKGSIVDKGSAWLYDWLGMDYVTAEGFKSQLAEAAGGAVVVEVNSPGGVVSQGAEIYEAIRAYEGDIEIHVVGLAASCASFIACAAKSTISPMGYLFLHNCLSSCCGNQHDMRQTMESLASIDENIMGAYKAKTGMSEDEIYELMEQNTTISAKRAVELGFIDEISGDNAVAFTAGGGVAGIAAALPGMFGLESIGADRLAALHDAYMRDSELARGGQEMENEEQAEEVAVEVAEAAANETVAAAGDANGDAAQAADANEPEDVEATASDQRAPEASTPDAYSAGVAAERERIQGIMAIADGIDREMVEDALFGNPVDAKQLAFNALAAGKRRADGYMAMARADVEASGSEAVAAACEEHGAKNDGAAVDSVAKYMKEAKGNKN